MGILLGKTLLYWTGNTKPHLKTVQYIKGLLKRIPTVSHLFWDALKVWDKDKPSKLSEISSSITCLINSFECFAYGVTDRCKAFSKLGVG